MIKLLLPLLVLTTSCSTLNKYKPVATDKEIVKPLVVAWNKNLDPAYDSGNLPISLGSALIHDDILYAADGEGIFRAYNADNGRELWSMKLKGVMTSAPVVFENLLIFGDNSGRLYARNLTTDKMEYEFDIGSGIDSTPNIYRGRLLVHTRNHQLFSVDAYTGKTLWSYRRSVPYFSTLQKTSRPLILNNKVYVGFADGYLVSFNLDDGQVTWERKLTQAQKFVDVDMKPYYVNGHLIVGSVAGKAEVIDAKSGALKKRLDFRTNSSPVNLGGQLVFGSLSGELVVLNTKFNEVKRVKFDEKSVSSLALWKKGLVATTVGKDVYYLNEDLQVKQVFDLGTTNSAVFGNISVDNERLAFISSRFRLYIFR